MTKQELILFNYITENVKSNTISINKNRILNANEDTIKEIMDCIKENATDKNYKAIAISLIEAGIKLENVDVNTVMNFKDTNGSVTIDKSFNGELYQKDEVYFGYTCDNEFQLQTKETQFNIDKLKKRIESLAESKTVTADSLESLARSFIRIRSTDNILIRYTQTKGSEVKEWIFDKEGFREKTEKNNNMFILIEKKLAPGIRQTINFTDGLPVSDIIKDNNENFPKYEDTEYRYDENGKLTRKKTVIGIETLNGRTISNYVYRSYKDDILTKIRTKDIAHGNKNYIIDVDSIIFAYGDNKEREDIYISLPKNAKEYKSASDTIQALKELDLLEGGLLQLKRFVPEITLDYDSLIPSIHNNKLVLGLEAVKDDNIVIYIADKGNTTLYDKEGTRIAYFPRNVLGNLYSDITSRPNTLVEQHIKNSDNPDMIRMIYWLGTQEGDNKGIYSFERIVRALAKNNATPSDILDSMVDKIIEGKYNNEIMVDIAQNKKLTKESIVKIIDSKPSLVVLDFLAKHPNSPTSEENKPKGKDIADSILG